MHESWTTILEWLATHAEGIHRLQQRPAPSKKTFNKALKLLPDGPRPPDDYRQWLLECADGQKLTQTSHPGWIPAPDGAESFAIVSIQRAVANTTVDRKRGKGWWQDSWFTFAVEAKTERRARLVFDMDADGAVLLVCDAPRVIQRVAPSFTAFLEGLAAGFASGAYAYDAERDGITGGSAGFPEFDALG